MEIRELEQIAAIAPQEIYAGRYGADLTCLAEGLYIPGGFEMYNSFGPLKPLMPAGSFGIGGGGLAGRIGSLPLIERYRYDSGHDDGIPHINYEVVLETLGRSRPMLTEHVIAAILEQAQKK